ncbi:MAG: peptidoglycan editing factor PgeF [Prevotella sp.]|nr:peptidoglycan editing factor PgeF [Prevotella sp.]
MSSPELLRYDFGPGVVAFSSTRRGGVSAGLYGEFNINEYCGDAVDAIRQNRLSLCQQLSITPDRLIVPHQVHGTVVCTVSRDFLTLSAAGRRQQLEGVDAVMTDVPQVCVGVSTADCIPVLLFDADRRAVCAVHAGWRGTVQRIVRRAVEAMQATYSTCPASLRAVIGPGISLDAFEVGEEVYEAFSAAGFDMQRIARRPLKPPPSTLNPPPSPLHPQPSTFNPPPSTLNPPPSTLPPKPHIDLWECNRQQLLACGVLAENIHVAGICTYQRCDDFFSARRLGINSGRIYSAVMLR